MDTSQEEINRVPGATVLKPDLEFIRTLKESGGDSLKNCYQCATCSVVCNLASVNHPFPRKQMIMAQWGLKDDLLDDPAVWMCHQCNDCSTNCPREAKPGDVLAAVRNYSFQHFAFPSFMGKALANKSSLPFLFLVPVLILFGILLGGSTDNGYKYLFSIVGDVDYARIFPHGAMDSLFVGGNLLIFSFAAFGLMRFWRGMKKYNPGKGPGFIPALIATVGEIGLHGKFSKCEENKGLYLGHLLLFYGFIGALVATALNFLLTVIIKFLGSPWYLVSPIDFPNPIKLIGIAGGIGMIVGGWILIKRRRSESEEVGISKYNDWLFLNVITLVGLTGLLAWILRVLHLPLLGYIDYYVHLVLVFFLLWYAPYSKFGHMFYRTLALVYTKSVGADNPRK